MALSKNQIYSIGGIVLVAIIGFVIYKYIPSEAKLGSVEEFRSVNDRVTQAQVSVGKVETRLDNIEKATGQIETIGRDVAEIRGTLTGLLAVIGKSKDRLLPALKGAATVEPSKLDNSLRVSSDLLESAKTHHVRLTPKEIKKEVAEPLFDNLPKGQTLDPAVHAWSIKLANFKSYSVDVPKLGRDSLDIKQCTNEPLLLDDQEFKRTVFKNCEIEYEGSSVVLDEVTFVNCNFKVTHSPNGARLLRTWLLEDNPTISVRITVPDGKRGERK